MWEDRNKEDYILIYIFGSFSSWIEIIVNFWSQYYQSLEFAMTARSSSH